MTIVPPSARVFAPSARRLLAVSTLLVLMDVVCPAPVRAGEDLQFWPTFTAYSRTVDGWRGSAEIQARWTDDLSNYNRTVYRLNGGRLFDNGVELFAGFERTEPGTSKVRAEDRFWEQIEHTAHRGHWSLANRARLEERFVEDAGRTAYRFRYRLRAQHPLGHTRWTFTTGDELWLHLNTVTLVGQQGIDQNRVTATVTRFVRPHLSIEPGYLLIYQNLPPPVPSKVVHVITLQVTARF